jgi:2-polyprenyl-3-methyl-5-hydroxy-6-metoxy-1,4-benzoquinol methylase
MIDLTRRSYRKELMDRDDIPFADMARTLRELNIINTRLGGHAITRTGVKKLVAESHYSIAEPLIICEIGCGGGDNLAAVFRYCQSASIPVQMIGIDINAECIEFARQQYPQLPCEWVCSDYALVGKHLSSHWPPHITFSSLFCHHFTDEQLVKMLQWLRKNTRTGFFINDLHRHWLAYYLIKYITKFFSKSYLVRNDAPISVSRGFRKVEWETLFRKAGFEIPDIRWKWAFRYLVMQSFGGG